MRKEIKYKIFNTVSLKTKIYPTRILKFRRPKWTRLQKLYLSNSKNKLVNILLIRNVFKSWERVKKYYKKKLETKNLLHCIYENNLKSKDITKNLSGTLVKRNLINNTILKPQFRVDILLWKLNFFSSSYESNQAVNSGFVFINGVNVKSNFFLKKGDVITFKRGYNSDSFFYNCVKKYALHENFLTFIEIDYYSKTAIVLKNYYELDYQDFLFLINEYLNIKRLSYR